ncbi:hypothetical protein IW261DRAFT_1589629 [Armillaria novae-zelandiae]|uniref:F-box domain-containing protein n=1 Tax=Armillaria novae-zelandiae TaxID=153914 RepID=A0AA39PNM3_9AGAR|nr:hypothetical protein IW261DRAFT_1589629 [Armillaria novae-zelandiae]
MSLISVSDILGTNYAPNEHDCGVIQMSLSEQEQLLEQVRAQKADLEQQLLVVTQRETQIVKSIADHRTLLRASHIRSLPAELLGEIFLAHCADSDARDSYGATLRKSRLLLLCVCAKWRDVALSTPRIWVALPVDCNYPTEGSRSESKISVLKKRVSSSGRLPLSIDFLFSEYHSAAGYQRNIFKTIFAQLHRCKSFRGRISFDVHGTDSVQREIDLDIPDAPMLESLTLGSYSIDEPTITWRRKLYTKIPRLRHLDIDSADGILSLPVKDMITVKLERVALSDLFYVVENATVLEELRVGYVILADQVSQQSRHDSRRLDRLFRLHFQRTTDTAVNKFINYVTLPSTKELTVRTTLAWADADAFTRFFKRSACSLTQLIVKAPDGDKHGFLLAVLPLVPSLQVLHVVESRDYHVPSYPLPSPVLEYITGKPRRQNLTVLTDLNVSVQLRQISSLKKLLDYRRTNWEKLGVARLEDLSVTIITSRFSAAQMKDRKQQMSDVFKPYKKAGFKWTIESRRFFHVYVLVCDVKNTFQHFFSPTIFAITPFNFSLERKLLGHNLSLIYSHSGAAL